MIEVELPDGSIAEFPDGTSPDAMRRAIQKRFPAPQPPAQSMGLAEDVARSGATGLREGVESAAGMFGDAAKMQGDAAGWLAGKLGFGETGQGWARSVGSKLHPAAFLPNTEQLHDASSIAVDAVPGGKELLEHEPQTVAGEYTRTVGQFVPGAFVGPGSAARKLVIGGGSALASETAGQMTKGTEWEPYARGAGALVGGLAGAKASLPSRKPQLPSARDIKASAGYKQLKPEMQAARVTKSTYSDIVRGLKTTAKDFGIVPEEHGAFERILKRHASSSTKKGASLQDLEILRRSLGNAGKSTANRSAGELSRQMIENLDGSIENLGGRNLVQRSGRTIDETLTSLKDARETWRTGVKAEMMEMATERAKNTASGFENGLRIEFRKILNNKTISRMFSDTEKEAMRQVVRGTFKGNALRLLGGFGVPLDNARNFMGSVMGGGVGATLGSMFGPVGTAVGGPALVAMGTAAKAGSNAITRNNALFAEALVKGGKDANRIAGEALMELRAAKTLGLIRSGVHAQQALRSPSREPHPR